MKAKRDKKILTIALILAAWVGIYFTFLISMINLLKDYNSLKNWGIFIILIILLIETAYLVQKISRKFLKR